jgi:hypothetical protein
MRRRIAAAGLIITLTVILGSCATMPDWTRSPRYGSATLYSDFQPDPYRVDLVAGGGVDLSSIGFTGYVAQAPDFQLYFHPGDLPLSIYVEQAEGDTVLLVNGPSGNWHYNDDADGLGNRPGIRFDYPEEGRYDIWVGSYSGGFYDAVLAVSEFPWDYEFVEPSPVITDDGFGVAAEPDWSLEPDYGSVDLSGGFLPDPHMVDVMSGGSVDLADFGYYGFVSAAPDYNLYYDAADYDLFIYVAEANGDTVLLVNDPNGDWYFSDDEDGLGLRSGLRFAFPESGLYNIWVGSYSDEFLDTVLAISEQGWSGAITGWGTEPDWSLEPNYGSVDLTGGFTPDPYTVDLTSGGSVNLDSMGFWGYVSSAPDFDLYYEPTGYELYIYVAEASGDTVLLVNDPSGEWHFSDDEDGLGLRSGVRFAHPEAGLYDIWVGSFYDEYYDAVLAISEIGWSGGTPGTATEPDWSLEPNYGSVELTGGFTPDPYTVEFTSGGSVNLDSIGYWGHVTAAPDFDLYYEATNYQLWIYVAEASGDTVLLINDPSGNWHFSDDEEGLGVRPGIRFPHPESGLYDIWVGSHSDEYHQAVLAISEGSWSGGEGPDWSAPPTYGSVDLSGGFRPDPYELEVVSGAEVNLSVLGYSGYTAIAPDLDLYYEPGKAGSLYIHVESSNADMVLLVHDPGGDWYFSDDADGWNPGLVFQSPAAGLYDIWVGSYHGDNIQAVLTISGMPW